MCNLLLYNFIITLLFSDVVLSHLVQPNILLTTEILIPKDAKLNFVELYGHPAEEYKVTTEDGYILTMHHIPGQGSPVLLQHGIIDSDDTFIIRGNNSMAVTLVEAGYDVWLGNARGNRYSRDHVILNPNTDKQFWNFSMHEIGYYDLPAMIDFVLSQTGQMQLSAIGHSQGNAIFYVLGATRPEYNKKIKVLIALAPICFLNHVRPPLNALVTFYPIINALLEASGQEELLRDHSALNSLKTFLCTKPFMYHICGEYGLLFIAGEDSEELNKEFLNVVLWHYPTGTSRNNLLHVAQIARANRFQQFDYGKKKNLQIYGTELPPKYDLKKVTMKVELFVGKNDKIATVEDVDLLRKKLPNARYMLMSREKMNHADFVWGQHMDEYLFPSVLQVLGENFNEVSSNLNGM